MGKLEKIALDKPPAPRVPAVVARLKIAERELADLKLQIPECLLAVAEGKPGAKEALTALHQKIAALTFEIESSAQARELAARLDEEALTAWKAAVQTLDPGEIVAGISRDECCHRCLGGNGCVISGADPLSGPCQHPLIGGALELNRYRDNPKIQAVYTAACAKLGPEEVARMTDVQQQPGTPGAPPAPPANATEARTRLDGLIKNQEWGAKLLSGDAGVNREYRELRTLADNPNPSDVVAVAMSGQIGEVPDSSVKMMADAADLFRGIGIREEVIAETLRGRELTPEEFKLVEGWRTRNMRDPVFVRAFLGGDPEARQKMTLSAMALSGGVKGGGRF